MDLLPHLAQPSPIVTALTRTGVGVNVVTTLRRIGGRNVNESQNNFKNYISVGIPVPYHMAIQ